MIYQKRPNSKKKMGGSQSTLKPVGTSPNGVVAGPFIGDPVTCLEVCTAKDVRGDILVGQMGGHLRMFSETKGSEKTEEELLESGYDQSSNAHTRFRRQSSIPRTDGVSEYFSGYSTLSLVRDDNVHAVVGAYSDGKRAYMVSR